MDSGGRRSRPGKAKRSTQQEQQQQEEAEAQQGAAAEGPAPECSRGEAPARLARVGLTENDALFGTRLRWASWGRHLAATGADLPACSVYLSGCPWHGALSLAGSNNTALWLHSAAACRKTLSLYLACLADAATASTASGAHEPEAGRPQALDTLQAAAAYLATPQAAGGSKVWEGCAKLAR